MRCILVIALIVLVLHADGRKQHTKQQDKNSSFQECLTSCVKSLKGSSDHSQLFACSEKCEQKSGLAKKMAKSPKGITELLDSAALELEKSAGGSGPAPANEERKTAPIFDAKKREAMTPKASEERKKIAVPKSPIFEEDSAAPKISQPTVSLPPIGPKVENPAPKFKAPEKTPTQTEPPPMKIKVPEPPIFKAPTPNPVRHVERRSETHTGKVKLHIGQPPKRHPDWTTVDMRESAGADLQLDARDLSSFGNGTVAAIYASHILQLFHYRFEDQVVSVLKEWHRVLAPGGELYISVPDMPTLAWLYLNPNIAVNTRFRILQLIMGAQEHENDAHHSSFDADLLSHYLSLAGFLEYERVPELRVFEDDSSSKKILDTFISLNMIARKPISPHRY